MSIDAFFFISAIIL